MRGRKVKMYPKLYRRSREFARREYVGYYDLEALEKGYYNGYVAGVMAVKRAIKTRGIRFSNGRLLVDEFIESIIGKPKVL